MKFSNLTGYALIKYSAILVSIAQGLVLVWVLTRTYSDEELAMLMLLFGVMAYFLVFDFGFGKPVYSELRKLYLSKALDEVSIELGGILKVYGLFCSFIFFAMLIFVLSVFFIYSPSSVSLPALLILAVALSISILISFSKDILDSLNEFHFYESIDLIRKTNLLLVTFSIALDPGLNFFSVELLLVNSMLVYYLVKRLFSYLNDDRSHNFQHSFRKYKDDAFSSLSFKVNEIIIYNWGFIVLPFFSDQLLIFYSVITRVFLGLSIPVRSFSDILIHKLTHDFHSGHREAVFGVLNKLTIASIVVSVLLNLIVFGFSDLLSSRWLNNKVILDWYLLLAIGVWTLGNSIQHPNGLMLVSMGGKFGLMSRSSFILMFLILIFSLFSLVVLDETLDKIVFIVSGIVYSAGGVFYFIVCRKELAAA